MSLAPEEIWQLLEHLNEEVDRRVSKALEPMRQQIEDLDDEVHCLTEVLLEALPVLWRDRPDVQRDLARIWAPAAAALEALKTHAGQQDTYQESENILRLKKMLLDAIHPDQR